MDKKNFLISITGGFLAGIGAAILVCTLYSYPRPQPRCMPHFDPQKIEMMCQHHFIKKGFKQHEPSAEMKEHFAKKLGLTEAQKAELDKFRQEDMAKMEPLMNQMNELRGQMKELWKENRAHFESVLTDKQKEILKNMKPHHKPHHHFKKPMQDK